MTTRTALPLLLAGALLTPVAARANCAAPVGYQATATGSTVVVQPWNGEARGCPDDAGLLRQSVATGQAVRVADFCQAEPAPDQPVAFVDECVAPGRYRYGFATPYACSPHACGTSYFTEVEVTAPLDPGCARDPGDPGPTAAAGVPWLQRQAICGHDGTMACGTLPAARGGVLLLDAAVLLGGLWLLRRRAARRG